MRTPIISCYLLIVGIMGAFSSILKINRINTNISPIVIICRSETNFANRVSVAVNLEKEGFFKIHRAEVIGMCLEAVSEEELRRIWHKDGYTEGLSKGEKKGRSEKAIEAARNAIEMKLTTEQVSKITGLPLEKVLELQKEITVQA